MRLINLLFNTLIGSMLIVSLLVALVIAMYLLKLMLEELFDCDGIEEFKKWLINCGKIVQKKKKEQ